MGIADAWDWFRASVVTAVARLMRVSFEYEQEDDVTETNPFAEDVQSRLLRDSIDAQVGAIWPVALMDIDMARQTSLVLLHGLIATLEVPLSAAAYELAVLYPQLTVDDREVSAFIGADLFGGRQAEKGEVSIREELHAFIGEALDGNPDGAVRVMRTLYERAEDAETGSDHCMELLAHLIASLAHRSAADAILEGADDTG